MNLLRPCILALSLLTCASAAAEVNGHWRNDLTLDGTITPIDLARDGERVLVGGGALDTSNLMRPWRPRVLLSDDGGRSFRNIEGALGQQNTSDPVRAVAFAGPAIVVARGSGVFRTTDDGANWTPGEAPGTVHALHFTDAASGVAVGDGGLIALTDDAGQSFVSVDSPTSVVLRGMTWADGSHGWAWGHDERRDQSPGGDGGVTIAQGTLLHTRDGGRSWEEVHRFDGQVVGPAFFPRPELGWVATAERTSEEGLRAIATLARSSDGGRTLTEIPLPDAVGELRGPFGGPQPLQISYLPGIRFDDPATGRIAALVHLFDSQSGSGGGGTNTTQRISGFRLLDLTTEDGGASWHYDGLGEVRASLTGVDSPNDGNVIRAALRHTHDGLLLTEDGRIWNWDNTCASNDDCLGQARCSDNRCTAPTGTGGFRAPGEPGGPGATGAPDGDPAGPGAEGPAQGRDRNLPGDSSGKGCAAAGASPAGVPVPLLALAACFALGWRRRGRSNDLP